MDVGAKEGFFWQKIFTVGFQTPHYFHTCAKKTSWKSLILILTIFLGSVSLRADQGLNKLDRVYLETIRDRYREFLFRTREVDPEVKVYAETLNEGNQWKDIDYTDQQPADWQVTRHLSRIREMALAWKNPDSPYSGNKVLWSAIEASLQHWLEERYWSGNWWHNRIGNPLIMRDILFLVGDDLDPTQRKGALAVFDQFRDRPAGLEVGANLTWLADLGLHYGILTGNTEEVESFRQLLVKEVEISTGEGVQLDYSYHQHGKRLQMYHYGKTFLQINTRLAWELRNTPFAFSPEKIAILENFIFQGWQWMARGVHTVPGTIDRASSRPGELRSPDIRKLIPFLKELGSGRSKAYEDLARRQNGKGNLSGFRYYPYSDFTAYHQDDFSFFLKTISERTLPTESINRENLKGQLLNSGDAYMIRNGEEYFNLMPVWNWDFLPGVTSFQGAEKINRKAFVGSVSNGKSGLSAMDYKMETGEGESFISTRKSWAVHENMVVCLIADIETKNLNAGSYTALDQARLQGEVAVNDPGRTLENGQYSLEEVAWIHHSGLAYILLTPAPFELKIGPSEGSWASINAGLSKEPLNEKIFLPVLQHLPMNNGATGYVMTAVETAGETQKLAQNPVWKVLRNDKQCQAVYFDDNTLMATFFSPTVLQVNGKSLKVDRPCLILLEEGKIYASDPTHTGGILNLKWKGTDFEIPVPEEGFTSQPVILDNF